MTGGAYFRARNTAGLVAAHQQIDALETTEGEAVTVRPTRLLFYWPLAGFFLGVVGLLARSVLGEGLGVRRALEAARMKGAAEDAEARRMPA